MVMRQAALGTARDLGVDFVRRRERLKRRPPKSTMIRS